MDHRALHIRHVLAGEHPRLRALRLAALAADPDAFGATYARDVAQPPDWWTRWAKQSEDGSRQRTFVVVDIHDRWLGLALARRDEESPGTAVLNAMWVAAEARGSGVAARLCDACADWAAERGLAELVLTVLVDNARARRAYEAAGFVARERRPWDPQRRGLTAFIGGTPGRIDDPRRLEELVMVRALRAAPRGQQERSV
jgi:RimJ/RimL family protein N-acetyltransferase